MSDFQPTVLGITAFMAPNRIDFVLDGPELCSPERASAYYDNPAAEIKLAGKKLSITGFDVNDDDEPVSLEIRWGRRSIKLGRRRAAGAASFYRSLESANDSAAPHTAAQISAALANFVVS
jgi:hypothetical protein